MIGNLVKFFLLLFVYWPASRAAADSPTPGNQPARHLLLQLSLEKGAITLVKATTVASPLPKVRGGPRAQETWRLTVYDQKGKQLHQAWLADPRWVQAELAEPGSPEKQVHARALLPEPIHFAVRVPDAPRGRLILERLVQEGDRQSIQQVGSVELPGERP